MINSLHAYEQIQRVFVEEYITSETIPSLSQKNAWQSIATCKATIEIMLGDTSSGEEIHQDMILKYKHQATVICEGVDDFCRIDNSPSYLNKNMLLTTDTKGEKELPLTNGSGKIMNEIGNSQEKYIKCRKSCGEENNFERARWCPPFRNGLEFVP